MSRANERVWPLNSWPKELKIAVAYFLACAKKQRSRAAGWIADAISRFWMSELGDDFGDLAWREELARLLSRIGSEPLDQKDVGIAQESSEVSERSSPGFAKSSSSVLSLRLRSFVCPRLVSELKSMARNKTTELALVGLFDRVEDNVNKLADVVPRAPFVKAVEVAKEAFFKVIGLGCSLAPPSDLKRSRSRRR